MAPSLYRRTEDDASSTHTSPHLETRDTAGVTISPWLIVVIVLGALLVTSLIAFLSLYLIKIQRRQIAQISQIDPLGREDFRKRRMSTSDRLAAEETERDTMIRKSLASRTSVVSSQALETSEYQLEEFGREERRPRDNWKELEAGTRGQRASPGLFDPEIEVHPALLPQPQLVVSRPSRTPSPMRGIQPPQLIIPS